MAMQPKLFLSILNDGCTTMLSIVMTFGLVIKSLAITG
jgi:hypothetical protein